MSVFVLMIRRTPRSTRTDTLFPYTTLCRSAQKAMQDITGKVRVEIKQTRGNMRRMALYWAILSTAAPILSNMIEGDPIDENMLHKILKDRRGLYREVILPSGEVWKDYESIRSDEHTSELQSLMRISYAVFCLKKKKTNT